MNVLRIAHTALLYVIALHPCVVQEEKFRVWTRDAAGKNISFSECLSLIFPVTHNTFFAIVYSLAISKNKNYS